MHDSSCILVLNASPSRNVPGNGSGAGMYMMHPTYANASSQQPQPQVGRSGPPPIPPRDFPAQPAFRAQPAYPIGDYPSTVPLGFDPAPYQPGTGYINDRGAPSFPEGPQTHHNARARGPDPGHYGLTTPSRPGPEPQYLRPPPIQSRSSSGGSSSGGSSYGETLYVYDTPSGGPVQVYVSQTV